MFKVKTSNGTLTEEQIIELVNKHSTQKREYDDNESYYRGLNPPIMGKPARAENMPDNRVPTPYARKMVKTVKGYMFSKQIMYSAEDEDYQNKLNAIFRYNKELKKTNSIGHNILVHGIGCELHFMKFKGGQFVDCFVSVDPDEAFVVCNSSIDPEPIAGIRHYWDEEDDVNVHKVEVHYPKLSLYCTIKDNQLILNDTVITLYSVCPMIEYQADKYQDGIFNAVKPLIDGIDTIASCDLNEVEKFELAYLVLQGQKLNKDDLDEVKEKRLFELDKDSTLNYLKHEIDNTFRGDIKAFFASLIFQLTGIPDFTDDKFLSSDSGKALRLKLVDLDNTCDEIENAMREGLETRITLIDDVLFRDQGERSIFDGNDRDVEFTFYRNLPEDLEYQLDIAQKMKSVGLTDETIFKFLPASMVDNVEEELKRKKKQKESFVDLQDIDEDDDSFEGDEE